jgi:RNA polymerase sigma-70 factor, ECF subfamily
MLEAELRPEEITRGEHALVDAIAAGDRHAFEKLYRLYDRRVFKYISSLVHNPATAEELVVDTMLAVWKGADRCEKSSRISTWIFGIARHKALDALRRLGRSAHLAPLDDAVEVATADPSPLDHAETRSAGEITRRAFDCLSSEHREVLYLAYFADTPYEQIATLLALPHNTVKTRVFYAKQKLREHLERLTSAESVR